MTTDSGSGSAEGSAPGGDERRVRRVFSRFVRAFEEMDFEAFAALHTASARAGLDAEDFLADAHRAEEHGLTFRARGVTIADERAELRYELRTPAGEGLGGESELTFLRDDDGHWRILES